MLFTFDSFLCTKKLLFRYNRLLKREKMKNHGKEFEALKEHNPQKALEKLEQLDKKRIEERMTLKHKGAGKWAKLQAIRSKYDENVIVFCFVIKFK